jgi:acetolactate synthase regulatory subunit
MRRFIRRSGLYVVVIALAAMTAGCQNSRRFTVAEDGSVQFIVGQERKIDDYSWLGVLNFDKDGRCIAGNGEGDDPQLTTFLAFCKNEPGALQALIAYLRDSKMHYSVCTVRAGTCDYSAPLPGTALPSRPTDPDLTPGGPSTGGTPREG